MNRQTLNYSNNLLKNYYILGGCSIDGGDFLLYDYLDNTWISNLQTFFKSGTCSYKLTKVNAKDPDGNWFCVGMELPEEFENYDYSSFYYKVEELVDYDAYYNNTEKMRCVSPEQL